MRAGGCADEGGQPVAMDTGLLEPLAIGEGRHPLVDHLDDLVRAADERWSGAGWYEGGLKVEPIPDPLPPEWVAD